MVIDNFLTNAEKVLKHPYINPANQYSNRLANDKRDIFTLPYFMSTDIFQTIWSIIRYLEYNGIKNKLTLNIFLSISSQIGM